MTDYGSDISCVTDIDAGGAVVSGRKLLGEAYARRLSTDRGTLIDDPNYGFNLMNYINDDLGPDGIDELQSGAEAEGLKDERILGCSVLASVDANGKLTVNATLEDADGPFDLVIEVTSLTLTLLKVNE